MTISIKLGARLLVSLLLLAGLFGLSACRSTGGGDDSSLGMTSKAMTDTERRANIRVELAVEYYTQRNFENALAELRTAIATNPNSVSAYNLFGLVYTELNENRRAEEAYLQGLRIAPNDSELNNNFGWFLCQTNRPKESIQYFNTTLRNPLYRNPAKATTNMGICSMRANNIAAAEEHFKRSLELDPGNSVTAYHLSELYLVKPDYQRAWVYAQALASVNSPSPEVLWLGVRAARRVNDRNSEVVFSDQLRRRFADSVQANKLARGMFDQP